MKDGETRLLNMSEQNRVKAVRALFNASFERYLMHLCRICVADELCQPGNLTHYGESRHEDLGYSGGPVASTERDAVA